MKRITYLFLLIGCMGTVRSQEVNSGPKAGSGLVNGQHDKNFLAGYFQQTYEGLERSVAGLTVEQLNYRPAPDQWTIGQCLAHIILTERMLFDEARKGLEAPASPKRRKDVKITDDEVIKAISGRTQKVKAPDALVAEGKYVDPEQALEELKGNRTRILAYLKERPLDDFRNHINDSPFGPTDGYHACLYIAGHTARHTAQIEEVKNASGFPR